MPDIPDPVAGELVLESWGDAVKDEVNALRDHTHDGTADQPPAVDYGDLANADHAATHQTGGGDELPADAAAGIPALRSLGTGAANAAAGNHSHTGLPLDFGESGDIATVGTAAAAGASGEIADAAHAHKLLGAAAQTKRQAAGPLSTGNTHDITVTWPSAFADANYTVVALWEYNTSPAGVIVPTIKSRAAASCVVTIRNQTGGNITGDVVAIAIHD